MLAELLGSKTICSFWCFILQYHIPYYPGQPLLNSSASKIMIFFFFFSAADLAGLFEFSSCWPEETNRNLYRALELQWRDRSIKTSLCPFITQKQRFPLNICFLKKYCTEKNLIQKLTKSKRQAAAVTDSIHYSNTTNHVLCIWQKTINKRI